MEQPGGIGAEWDKLEFKGGTRKVERIEGKDFLGSKRDDDDDDETRAGGRRDTGETRGKGGSKEWRWGRGIGCWSAGACFPSMGKKQPGNFCLSVCPVVAARRRGGGGRLCRLNDGWFLHTDPACVCVRCCSCSSSNEVEDQMRFWVTPIQSEGGTT